MERQSQEEMEEYLRPTKMCDCDNTQLRQKAEIITKAAGTPKEAALNIFYYTRDEILFGLDYPDIRASQTLKKGRGFCITKSNLQIALLRSIGIPARCHYVHLAKESLQAIVPAFMYNKLPEAIVHIWCECYLSGNWLACEGLFDEKLYRGMLKKGAITQEQVPSIDWDGATSLILVKQRIVKDIDTFPSWDDAMADGLKRGDEMPLNNRILGLLFLSIVNRRIRAVRRWV